MKKKQDVGAIADAPDFYQKLSVAIEGRWFASGASKLLSAFRWHDMFSHLASTGKSIASVFRPGQAHDQASHAEQEDNCLAAQRQREKAAEIVFQALKTRNREFFLHLADACTYKDYMFPEQSSRADVLVLLLKYEHGEDWPNIPMTRAELEVYLARHEQGGIDPKTLTAIIKRTGVKLRKDKPGPRAERKSRTGSG